MGSETDGALIEAERLMRSIAEASPDWIYVFDLDGMSVEYMNRSILRQLGYSEEIAQEVRTVEALRRLMSTEDASVIERMLDDWRRLGDGEVCEHEHRMRHADGSIHYFAGRETVLARRPDGTVRKILGTLSDLTGRMRTEAALRESEARLNRAQEVAHVGSWYIDMPGGALTWSAETYRIFGIPVGTPVDYDTFLTFIHPEDREVVDRAWQAAVRGARYEIEHRIVVGDAVKWVREQAELEQDGEGRILRGVGTVQDITDRKELEEQFRQAQKMESLGQFAGGIAHDFNNLLLVIGVQAELAECVEGLPAAARASLEQIGAATARAADLARQLLVFSRRQVLEPRDIDLNEVVTELAQMLARVIGEDVHLDLALHTTPLPVRADPRMLDQVLMNLAVNARDAMPVGGRLRIATAEHTVGRGFPRTHPDVPPGTYARLEVRDEGRGIPADVLPRVFEPFFTTKESGKGTGLGLATVFGIVKQHGGSISVTSAPGRGTTFQILLPFTTNAPAPLVRAERPEATNHHGTETILVVEDDEAVSTLVRTILERQGHRVLEARSGAEAAVLWHDHRQEIALLITDVVMPGGMSGVELARSLRAERPELEVIYTSGYSTELTRGATDLRTHFLQKPFSREQLLETVRSCFERRA